MTFHHEASTLLLDDIVKVLVLASEDPGFSPMPFITISLMEISGILTVLEKSSLITPPV